MSTPSNWPLPADSFRYLVPQALLQELRQHPFSSELYLVSTGHYVHALGHRMERASPDDHILLYCTRGCGSVSIKDQQHSIEKGQLVLLPPKVRHQYQANHQDPWSLYWVHFSGPLSAYLHQQIIGEDAPPVRTIGLNSQLIAEFESLFMVRQTGYQLAPHLHACSVLRLLLSQMAWIQTTSKDADFPLEKIHSLMQEKLHDSLSLDDMANAANMSRFHFSKRYKELTGQSPVNQFIHLKVEYACQLLDGTTQSISTIAANLGYRDPYYFSRLFKKVIGVSPAGYRIHKQSE